MNKQPQSGSMAVCIAIGIAFGLGLGYLFTNVDLSWVPDWAIWAGIIICIIAGFDCVFPSKKR